MQYSHYMHLARRDSTCAAPQKSCGSYSSYSYCLSTCCSCRAQLELSIVKLICTSCVFTQPKLSPHGGHTGHRQ